MTLHNEQPMYSPAATSTGLQPHTAAALAYSGWWLTGLVFWFLERRDRFVRFHAAQSVAAFGLISAVIVACGVCAAVSLSFFPSMFGAFVVAAAVTWLMGLALSAVAMWKAATGQSWRMPFAARVADRMAAVPQASGPVGDR